MASLKRRTLRDREWHAERVFLISGRSLEVLRARGMLALKRRHRVIENQLHHWLDITLREDWSRVSNPDWAQVPGKILRLIVSLANAAVNRAR